jgi:predicted GNAT superfamily acetyltransferase
VTSDVTAVEIRELSTLDECRSVDPLFEAVWGPSSPPIGIEMLRALAHSGGYVSGAFYQGSMVGACVAFVTHKNAESLHSHTTGVTAAARGLGVGRALKEHQRDWALARGIKTITWTFDPLVRRNAWFNIAKLGALPHDYLVDFYGPMPDDINRSDESDRLHMEWVLEERRAQPEVDVTTMPKILACVGETPVSLASDAEHVLVATPPDIEELRRQRPDLAHKWRLALRDSLSTEMDHGRVIGFTQTGEYVIRRDRGWSKG